MYSQYEILNFGTFLKIYFTKKTLKKKASERLDTSEKSFIRIYQTQVKWKLL